MVGVNAGDVVTISSYGGNFANKNVGINKAVNATLTIAGADAFNYLVTQPTGLTATISAKPISISNAVASNKVYDKTANAVITGVTLVGVLVGDAVAINSQTGTFSDINVGVGKTITAAIVISGTDAANYSLTQPTGLTAAITTRPLTISNAVVSTKVYDGTSAAVITGTTLVGIVSGDDVTLNTKTGSFSDKNIGTNKVVTAAITITGTDAANYSLTQPTGLTAAITTRPLTISNAVVSTKVYDGTSAAVITGATLVGIVSGDDVTINTQIYNFNNKSVGTFKSVTGATTLTGVDATNYYLTQPTGLKANITPAALTVCNAVASSKVYDGTTNTTISGASLVGVVSDDVVSINTQTASFVNKNVGIDKIITPVITLTGNDVSNYTLTQPTGLTATITAKPLTIGDAVIPNKIYDGKTDARISSANLVGYIPGDNLAFEILTCDFKDKNVGVGKEITATLSLSGTDAANYTITPPVDLKADITPASLTIAGSFTVADKVVDGNADAIINENNLTLQGTISNDAVELKNPIAEFSQAEVGENIVVSLISTELTGADTANYTLSLENSPTTTAAISYRVNINDASTKKLSVYPNPFNDNINLVCSTAVSKIILTRLTGQKLIEKTMNGLESINTSNLQSGVYFLSIELINGRKQIIKLIKQ